MIRRSVRQLVVEPMSLAGDKGAVLIKKKASAFLSVTSCNYDFSFIEIKTLSVYRKGAGGI